MKLESNIKINKFTFFSFLFICLIPLNTYADCDGGSGDGDCSVTSPVASSKPIASPSKVVGNPISLITGNKYQHEVDYEASGGVASLVLNRFYNSLNTTTDTGIGFGWRHSFDVRLKSSTDKQTLQINQSDGRRIVFKRDANAGLYRAVSPSDGTIARLGKWPVWFLNDGRQIRFNGIFPTKITYTDNRSFSLKYKGKGYDKKLSRVIDHQGRVLKFKYSNGNTALADFSQIPSTNVALAGHLESVTLPSGGVITYHYDTDHNLSKVLYPDGTSRVYHYEDIGFPNHLTGITNRTGKRFATWGYDDEGRANLSEHANSVDKVNLEYHIPEQAGDIGTTIVTNSQGKKSTYTWKFYPRISQRLLLSSEGPGCSTCPAPNKRYTYNNHYQLETIKDIKTQNVTRYTYDEQGRTLKISSESIKTGGDVLEKLVARYEYEGNAIRPSLIAKPSANADGEQITQITYNEDQLPITITEKNGTKKVRSVKLDYNHAKIIKILTTQDNKNKEVFNFQYNKAGLLSYRQLPSGQEIFIEARNKANLPTKVRLKQTKEGQLVTYQLQYDWEGNVTEISQDSRKVIFEYFVSNDKEKIKNAQIIVIPKKQKNTIIQKLNMTFGITAYASNPSKTFVKGTSGKNELSTLIELKAVAKIVKQADSADIQKYLSGKYQKSSITMTPDSGKICPVTNGVTCLQLKKWHKYGEFAQCSYEPATCTMIDGGQWQHMSAAQLGIPPDLLQKGDYYATVLINSVTGEMVLSFRGTDDAKGDLFNDIVQGFGVTTDQYANALKLAEALNLNFPNKNITVTGHSLGGGLASIAALKLGTDAIIFNAAGLHPKVAADANLSVAYSNANDNITNVTVDGEILTTLQESGTIKIPGTGQIFPPIPAVYIDPPEAIGNHIVLDAPSDSWIKNNSQYSPFDWINNSELVKSGTKHRMISVMESIEQQQKAKGCKP